MPVSPLIRPLSPLQTQSAPTLPTPYNLADAILAAYRPSTEQLNHDGTPRRPLSSPLQQSAVTWSKQAQQRHSSCSTAASQQGGGLGESRTLFEAARSPLHHADDAVAHEKMYMRSSERHTTPEPSLRPLLISSGLGDHHAYEPRAAPPSASLPPSAPTIPATTKVKTDSPALLVSAHPYHGASLTPLQPPRRHGNDDARTYVSPHRNSGAGPVVTASTNAVAAALLRSSTAKVAVAASKPSFGELLLRGASPKRVCAGWGRRCASSPPTSRFLRTTLTGRHLCRGGSSRSSSSNTAKDSVSPFTCSIPSAADAAVVAAAAAATVEPNLDDAPADVPANVCSGTAVSTGTCRHYHISIEAALPDASPPAARPHRVAGRTIVSALCPTTTAEKEGQRVSGKDHGGDNIGASQTTTAAAETAPAEWDASAAPAQSQPSEGRRASPILHRRQTSPSPSNPNVSSTLTAPQCATTPTLHTAAPPPCWATAHPIRYVYPALEDCQRLLDEIQAQSPLMRRCLAPPRPLAAAEPRTSEERTFSSLTASQQQQPISTNHGTAGEEARRLYHWSTRAAAEDLAYTHGAFQQSPDRFATSTARQLRRLQEAGARLYGSEKERKQSSFLSSSLSGAPSPPYFSAANPEVTNDTAESPSQRLNRLLRETDAAFPVLWRATHLNQDVADSGSRVISEPREASVPGSGSAALLLTPSPSSIQPVQGERSEHAGNLRDVLDGTTSVKGGHAGSNYTLRRLNEQPSEVSSAEMPARISVAAMTPARPLSVPQGVNRR